jgi:segregation and condensation protein A
MSEVTQEQVNLEGNLTETNTEEANQIGPVPFALLNGEAFNELPPDLYIPPEALRVFLDAFEGPLDLLLYLIKRQNIEIVELPIAEITKQYMDYVNLMESFQFDLAAEYLVMAAMLAEIKSRMLLPRPKEDEAEGEDPRAELIRRLQEYERFKKAAAEIDDLPRRERDTFPAAAAVGGPKPERKLPDMQLKDLVMAFRDVVKSASLRGHHHVAKETLSLRERMSIILTKLESCEFVPFTEFFNLEEGRMGVVVSFIAVLELLKGSMIEVVQAEIFGSIHVRAVAI